MKPQEIDKMEEELDKLAERMYQVNATISGRYVSGLYKITGREVRLINGNIGEWIKKIREINDKLKEEAKE